MKKSELIQMLNEIEGDPEIRILQDAQCCCGDCMDLADDDREAYNVAYHSEYTGRRFGNKYTIPEHILIS